MSITMTNELFLAQYKQWIAEMKQIAALELSHDLKKDWTFFRDAARTMMWPRIEQEYRDELQGITDGVTARGQTLDLWDIVALNALLEWSYYVAELDKLGPSPMKGFG